MWLFYARAPAPDARPWPGRRCLAVVDAMAWPLVAAAFVAGLPFDGGIVGSVTSAACAFIALRRAARALWRNEKYRFTTSHVGIPLVVLLAMGIALKVIV